MSYEKILEKECTDSASMTCGMCSLMNILGNTQSKELGNTTQLMVGQSESKQRLEVMERTGLSQADLTMKKKIQLADLFIRFWGTWDRPDNAPVALFNQQFLACSYFSLHFWFSFSTKLSNISPGAALSGNYLTISSEMNTGEIIAPSSAACTGK